ncbi:MAG: CCA-adding enzyme [Firmicutes bacterium ADurb.Bin193]|nr:MAG: CCA-adding enzyme [Firmicutes bacterium ADurb.Bin193]
MQKMELPEHVEEAMRMLEANGYDAFVVGGAVRDTLMGAEPLDWDVATDALPDRVKTIFKKHFDSGIKHGTVTVFIKSLPIEITTYRTEGDYKDYRRPETVSFTTNLYDDLIRRDFTINALAYNHRFGFIDLCHGINDLEKRVLRCIGDANERFGEDALRILRALRFAATLNFGIEDKTYIAICNNKELLRNISYERIAGELTKLIMADNRIEMLFETGVGEIILPEVSRCFSVWQNTPNHIFDVGLHTIETVYNVPKTPILRYAALLHDVGKPDTKRTDIHGIHTFPKHDIVSAELAREILIRLKMPRKLINAVTGLIRMHRIKIKPTETAVKRVISSLKDVDFKDLLTLQRGDIIAQNPKYAQQRIEELDRLWDIYCEVLRKNEPVRLKDLAVNGNDMKAIGLRSSEIGRTLRMLLSKVIKNPELNKKEILMEIASKYEKCKN